MSAERDALAEVLAERTVRVQVVNVGTVSGFLRSESAGHLADVLLATGWTRRAGTSEAVIEAVKSVEARHDWTLGDPAGCTCGAECPEVDDWDVWAEWMLEHRAHALAAAGLLAARSEAEASEIARDLARQSAFYRDNPREDARPDDEE